MLQEKQKNNSSNSRMGSSQGNPRDNPIFQMLGRQKNESIRRKQQRIKEEELPHDLENMTDRERLGTMGSRSL